MRFPLSFLFLALLLPSVRTFGALGTQPSGVATVSTNGFSSSGGIVYSRELINYRNEFWDDFDGPTMLAPAFRSRVSPSGHTYRLHATAPDGTNGFMMTGGRLVQTQHLSTPFYLSVSNDAPAFQKPWNRFGAVYYWRSNSTPAGFYSLFGMLLASTHVLGESGDFFHSYPNLLGDIVVQRSITENILVENNAASLGAGDYQNGRRVFWEVNVFSNCFTLQCGGYVGAAYYTNLAAFTRWPVVQWELNGSATNNVTAEIDSIWAGWADPALEILANQSSKLSTNLTTLNQITTGTLVGANGGAAGGTYTNTGFDSIVAIGNGLAAAGTARTNKLYHHNNAFGKRVLVYDPGNTAAGSNIVVETMDSSLIYPGAAVRTNITSNGGCLELLRVPGGWQLLSRF